MRVRYLACVCLLHQADVRMPILFYAVWCMCASASVYMWVDGMLIGKLCYISMLPASECRGHHSYGTASGSCTLLTEWQSSK